MLDYYILQIAFRGHLDLFLQFNSIYILSQVFILIGNLNIRIGHNTSSQILLCTTVASFPSGQTITLYFVTVLPLAITLVKILACTILLIIRRAIEVIKH